MQVYLNGKDYQVNQLVDIFSVDRDSDTVSGWLMTWETLRLMRLHYNERSGRPRRITEKTLVSLENDLAQSTPSIQDISDFTHDRIFVTNSELVQK